MKRAEDSGISIRSVIEVIQRRRVLVAIPTACLILSALLYAWLATPRYRAQSLLMAEQTDYVRPASTIEIQEQLQTIRVILYSRMVLETIVREFNLYEPGQTAVTDRAIEVLQSRIRVQIESDNAVAFHVSFEGDNPSNVMNVANRLAELLISRASEMRGQRANEAAGFIGSELDEVRRTLDEQNENIRQYRQRFAYELPENQFANMNVLKSLEDQLQSRTESIIEEEARRTSLLGEIQQMEAQGIHETGIRAEAASGRDARLETLRLKLAELRTRYTNQHPDVLQLQFEIAEVEKQDETRTATRQSEMSPAQMRYLQLKADLAALEQKLVTYKRDARRLPAQIESYRRRIQGAPEHERLLAELRRDLETTQSKYDDLISKQQQAQTGERLERMNRGVLFRIVEPASLPTHPVAPNRLRILLAGAFAGLGLGLLLGFIAEQMDTAFENLEQLQGFTDLPVLAVIPPLWSEDAKLPEDRGAGLNEVSPIATEQYRTLATRLRYLRDTSAVIAVTSTAGGEGKSVTAIQLASELAEVGSGKVLLVDGDLRKPSVQRYMNLPEGPGGDFVRLLMSPDDDAANYIHRIGRLNVLPTFHGHSKSTLLLGSPETGRLFAELRKRFHFIIVDSPPLLPLADGHILSRLVDDVILVVRARRTPRQVFRRALESLSTDNIMGIVLNDVEYRSSQYAYAYEYYTRNYSMRD